MKDDLATIELERFEKPIIGAIERYYPAELDKSPGDVWTLAYVAFRVRLGRDAFRVQILLDIIEGKSDVEYLEEARHRCVTLLRAGSKAAGELVRWT